VAEVSPKAVVPERARFLNSSIMELQLPISEAGYEKLKKAQNLMSQLSLELSLWRKRLSD